MTVRIACIGCRQKPFRLFSATHIDVDVAANSWNSSQVDRRSWKSQKQVNAEASSSRVATAPFSLPPRPFRASPRAAHSSTASPHGNGAGVSGPALRGLSPPANYTGRATAASRRS
jgi:hypothetical protein